MIDNVGPACVHLENIFHFQTDFAQTRCSSHRRDYLKVQPVKAARTVPASSEATWALTVDEVHVSIPALLHHLQGKPLTRLSTHHATLEDVFVSLTGRQLRE